MLVGYHITQHSSQKVVYLHMYVLIYSQNVVFVDAQELKPILIQTTMTTWRFHKNKSKKK
jgi:hypothetical protein